MEQLQTILPILALLMPVIIGINQLLKSVGVPSRFVPLINIALGFMAYPLIVALVGVYLAIIGCIILGLAVGGFYDLGVKTVLNK